MGYVGWICMMKEGMRVCVITIFYIKAGESLAELFLFRYLNDSVFVQTLRCTVDLSVFSE